MDFISSMEEALGRKAKKNFMPMQLGDVPSTWASTNELFRATGYRPIVDLKTGVGKFINWYENFYKK